MTTRKWQKPLSAPDSSHAAKSPIKRNKHWHHSHNKAHVQMLEKKSQNLNFNKEYPKYSHKEKYLTHTSHDTIAAWARSLRSESLYYYYVLCSYSLLSSLFIIYRGGGDWLGLHSFVTWIFIWMTRFLSVPWQHRILNTIKPGYYTWVQCLILLCVFLC